MVDVHEEYKIITIKKAYAELILNKVLNEPDFLISVQFVFQYIQISQY